MLNLPKFIGRKTFRPKIYWEEKKPSTQDLVKMSNQSKSRPNLSFPHHHQYVCAIRDGQEKLSKKFQLKMIIDHDAAWQGEDACVRAGDTSVSQSIPPPRAAAAASSSCCTGRWTGRDGAAAVCSCAAYQLRPPTTDRATIMHPNTSAQAAQMRPNSQKWTTSDLVKGLQMKAG